MRQAKRIIHIAFVLAAAFTPLFAIAASSTTQAPPGVTELFSQVAARLIAEAIPREYEGSKDWGRTRELTTGLRSSGNFFKFDVHRHKSQVEHGVWKQYRVTLIEPDRNLIVTIDNLRAIEPGHVEFTLLVRAKLRGWARAKVYDNGVHIISLEVEGDTDAHLSINVDVLVEAKPSALLQGVAIRPVVTDARLELSDFRLTRISDVKGPLVAELSDGVRHLIDHELSGQKLADTLNRSISKHPERLQFAPNTVLEKLVPMASKMPAPEPDDH